MIWTFSIDAYTIHSLLREGWAELPEQLDRKLTCKNFFTFFNSELKSNRIYDSLTVLILIAVQKNLRNATSFYMGKNSRKYPPILLDCSVRKLMRFIFRAFMPVLKDQFIRILGIGGEGTKNKDEMVEKILNFLMSPHDHGKKIPPKKGKRFNILLITSCRWTRWCC